MAGCYYMSIAVSPPSCGVFPRDEFEFSIEHDPSWCARDAVERRTLLSFIDQRLISNTFTDFLQRWRSKGHAAWFTLERSLECSAGWPDWGPGFEDCEVHFGYRRNGETAAEAVKDLLNANGDDPEEVGGKVEDWEAEAIFMRPIRGMEAEEAFDGEYKSGWVPCAEGAIDALPFWEVRMK